MYYEIAGMNTRILGALHAFPLEGSPSPQWVEDAFEWSESIVMEHDRNQLVVCFHDPVSMQLKPWADYLRKVGTAFAQMPRRPGVEEMFAEKLRTRSRAPMTYLEMGRTFADLMEAVPLQDLAGAEDSMNKSMPFMSANFRAMYEAWVKCDYNAMDKLRDESPLGSVPSLRHAVFDARNENWATTVAERGASDERQLLVVGGLHLIGAGCLLDRLAACGLVVNRLIE